MAADRDRLRSTRYCPGNRFVNGLLEENQHPPPEKLSAVVRKACEEWQNGAREEAASDLAEAIKIAEELHYI